MSDVALVALFSGCATVLVAMFGVVSAIFGPLFVERIRARALARSAAAERYRTRNDLRFERATELAESLMPLVNMRYQSELHEAHNAASRFVAVLDSGEMLVAAYVRSMVDAIAEEQPQQALGIATKASDHLFAYLRGDGDIPQAWAEYQAASE